MPEQTPPASPQSAPVSPESAGQSSFDIAEEFGTAKKNLPPAKVVLIAVGALAVLIAILSFVFRSQSSASGSIDFADAAEIEGQNSVMALINVSVVNHGEQPYKIQDMKVDLDTGDTTHTDDAASAIDFDRYLQAVPALKAHVIDPLRVDSSVPPGGEAHGSILVSFPIHVDAFTNRKSLKVTISAYKEHVPLILTK